MKKFFGIAALFAALGLAAFFSACSNGSDGGYAPPPAAPVLPTYTVAFNSNGGSDVASQTVTSGQTASKPADPTKEHFKFVEWCSDQACQTAFDFATPITNDTILYAKWESVIYTVTLEYNNGSESQTQSVESGQTAAKPADPTKDHFNFAGWCSDAECQTPFDFATPIVGDTNLYAKWSNLPVYIVTFDLNGGKYGSSDTYTQNIEDGSKAMRPASDPAKDDYVSGDVTTKYAFDNWYADAGCSTLFDFDATAITGPTTVYAKWNETKYYAVKIASGIEHGSVSSDAAEHIAAGTLVTLTAAPNPNYEFVSYTVTAGASAVEVEDGKFTMPASPVTVSATFRPAALTLEAIEAGAKVTFNNKANGPVTYRVNGGVPQTIESKAAVDITLEKVGDRVSFYGDNATYNESYSVSSNIACDKYCYVYGNVMSLIDSANYENAKTLSENTATFRRLFYGNSHIKNKSSEELILPATELVGSCYSEMFSGCTSLTSAPALPATTLARSCYAHMFSECTSLTNAPALPATTLAEYCYEGMFYGCTNLTNAPILRAIELVRSCYACMFCDCKNLKSLTCLAITGMNSNNATHEFLSGAAYTGTFTRAKGVNWSYSFIGIPYGWTFVNYQE
ncbi:MAG: InlB B-repeat-containing protein [Treponema sp.]|nr:InlB B-repeat-containing protein [Treponema sp.]